MVESSRSMTAAVTTVPNATHRHFRPASPADLAVPSDPLDSAVPEDPSDPICPVDPSGPALPVPAARPAPSRCDNEPVITVSMPHCDGCPASAPRLSRTSYVVSGADDIG